MTQSVTIRCEGADGSTLDAVARMIAARSEALGETTKDAVISTAINILTSLRSSTKDAKRNRRNVPRAKLMAGLHASVSHGRVCLRHQDGTRLMTDRRIRYLTRGLNLRDCHAYEVAPEHSKVRPYIVVADSIESAINFEKSAARHRIENYGTLAKCALGVAMNKLSTRNVVDGVSVIAKNAASKLSRTEIYGGTGPSGEFGLTVEDSLDYSVGALRSPGDFDLALRKAANRTAGIVNHHMHKLGVLDRDVPTPFPEVKRRSA